MEPLCEAFPCPRTLPGHDLEFSCPLCVERLAVKAELMELVAMKRRGEEPRKDALDSLLTSIVDSRLRKEHELRREYENSRRLDDASLLLNIGNERHSERK